MIEVTPLNATRSQLPPTSAFNAASAEPKGLSQTLVTLRRTPSRPTTRSVAFAALALAAFTVPIEYFDPQREFRRTRSGTALHIFHVFGGRKINLREARRIALAAYETAEARRRQYVTWENHWNMSLDQDIEV